MPSVSGSLTKESPRLMGVINLTSDSFSDGGHLFSGNKVDLSKALRKVEKLINEGADILDFGAESTRPGFTEIPSQVQIDRLIPILEQIKDEDILISVDSRDYKVLYEASKFGMKFINDVSKNISQKKLKLAKEKELFICTTHHGNKTKKTSNILMDVDKFFQAKEKSYFSNRYLMFSPLPHPTSRKILFFFLCKNFTVLFLKAEIFFDLRIFST